MAGITNDVPSNDVVSSSCETLRDDDLDGYKTVPMEEGAG